MKNQPSNRKINPFMLVILSFAIVILIGSILLCFPFSNVWGEWLWNVTLPNGQHFTYFDSLLTAVSATCVTGVSTYQDGFANSLTFAGQLITIIMVQIGGLGFITILTFIITLIKHKLQFKDRVFVAKMVNSTTFADVIKFVRRIILISFICETLVAILSLPVFITMFPHDFGKVVWYSIFHSISSFNNAGFDLFDGTTSLIGGLTAFGAENGIGIDNWLYYYFCTIMMLSIVTGGISFLVLIEVFSGKKKVKQFSLFTKSVLLMSGVLILGGAISIYLADGFKSTNPISFFDALFQSITCRTAGFATYKPSSLSLISKLISCFLMFIGGAPLGTAGGIKITTLYVIILAIICFFKGKKVTAFNRMFTSNAILKAMSLTFISAFIILVSYMLLMWFGFADNKTYGDVINQIAIDNPSYLLLESETSQDSGFFYEILSCFGTTGFFIGFEPYLSVGSKIVLCLLMFLGRLGPMTFFQLFNKNMEKEDNSHFELVEEEILIG